MSRGDRVNSNSGTYVAYVGGNYNDNDNYGLFYLNANNNASNTNANIGSRHLVFKSTCALIPCHLAKISPIGQGLVG